MDKIVNPEVSVVMPVYNCELYVKEAIESILDQTFTNFELIIIDDHSTDDTLEIIRSFSDRRIKLIVKPQNSGYTTSLNMGIEKATGQYIARMDGDDISNTHRLKEQVDYLVANPDISVCGTWFMLTSTQQVIKHPAGYEDIKVALLSYCPIGHPTAMIRRSFLIKNKLQYNTAYEPAEDYYLWTQAFSYGKMANIPKVLLQYRVHNNQVSNKKLSIQQHKAKLCSMEMLYKLIDHLTEDDKSIIYLAYYPSGIQNQNTLITLIKWLEHLLDLNRKKMLYKKHEFNQFISGKKTEIIRLFFLNRVSYSPGLLYCFLLIARKNNQSLIITEQIKLFLKCLIFWKSGTGMFVKNIYRNFF